MPVLHEQSLALNMLGLSKAVSVVWCVLQNPNKTFCAY